MTKTEITVVEPLVIDRNSPVLYVDGLAAFGMAGSVIHLTLTAMSMSKGRRTQRGSQAVVCAHLHIPAYAIPALHDYLGKALLMGTKIEGAG